MIRNFVAARRKKIDLSVCHWMLTLTYQLVCFFAWNKKVIPGHSGNSSSEFQKMQLMRDRPVSGEQIAHCSYTRLATEELEELAWLSWRLAIRQFASLAYLARASSAEKPTDLSPRGGAHRHSGRSLHCANPARPRNLINYFKQRTNKNLPKNFQRQNAAVFAKPEPYFTILGNANFSLSSSPWNRLLNTTCYRTDKKTMYQNQSDLNAKQLFFQRIMVTFFWYRLYATVNTCKRSSFLLKFIFNCSRDQTSANSSLVRTCARQ